MKYTIKKSKKAKSRKGKSYVATGKKPKLGSGARFAALTSALKKKGAKNPAAVAAFIGRKKYGKKKFQKLATKGRGNKSERKFAKNMMMS